MNFWKAVFAILRKDIRAELRTKDIFSSMFVFALLSVIVFNFAFELRIPKMAMVAPGIIWVAVSFAGTLGLNRAFVIEQDKGSLAGLLLAPVDRAAIYFGKMLGNLVFMLVVEAMLLPLIMIFFNLPLLSGPHLLVLLLGTYGFAAVGTVFSAIAVNTRARGLAADPAFSRPDPSADRGGQDDRGPARRRKPQQHGQLVAVDRHL